MQQVQQSRADPGSTRLVEGPKTGPMKTSSAESWSVTVVPKNSTASDIAPQIALRTIAGIATEGLGISACAVTKVGIAEGEVSLGSAIVRFRLDILNAEHFVGPVAARCFDFDTVAFFLADQGAGNRTFHIEQPLFNIRLVSRRQSARSFSSSVSSSTNRTVAPNLMAPDRLVGSITSASDNVPSISLTRPSMKLCFFTCRMIFGVFRQVTVFAGLGNGFYNRRAFG